MKACPATRTQGTPSSDELCRLNNLGVIPANARSTDMDGTDVVRVAAYGYWFPAFAEMTWRKDGDSTLGKTALARLSPNEGARGPRVLFCRRT